MTDLPIPDASLAALDETLRLERASEDFYGADYYREEVRAIATAVVAAELRRIADSPQDVYNTDDCWDVLRARADELETP